MTDKLEEFMDIIFDAAIAANELAHEALYVELVTMADVNSPEHKLRKTACSLAFMLLDLHAKLEQDMEARELAKLSRSKHLKLIRGNKKDGQGQ